MAPPSCYSVGSFSLPVPHGMHLVAQLSFARLDSVSSQQDTSPKKNPGRNVKIGLPLSPPPNHALLPLTHDLIVPYIGCVQAGEVWVLRVPSFHICPKIYLLLSRPPWSGDLPTQPIVRSLIAFRPIS